MKHISFGLISALFLFSPVALAAPNGGVGIAAIVNDDIITFTDVESRLALYIAGKKQPPADVRKQLTQQTLDKLIEEKLQTQEAATLGIKVSDDELKNAFASIAQKNQATPDQFKTKLRQSGVRIETLYDQIRSEIAWGTLARRKLRPKINISESEIDSEIEMMRKKGIAIPKDLAPTRDNPQPLNIDKAIDANKNNAPAPATSVEKTVTTAHLKQIMIPLNTEDPEVIINAKINRAMTLKDEIKNCTDMDQRMTEFTDKNTADLGNVIVKDLPKPLQETVQNTPLNTLSAPIRTADGVAVIMVCDRSENTAAQENSGTLTPATTASSAPSKHTSDDFRNEVANQIGFRRLIKMQERYLSDLHTAAYIDKRL